MPWEVSKKGNNFLPWFLGVKIENKQKSLISYVHRDSVIWLKNNKHWYIFLSDRFWIESQSAPCFLAKRLWKSYISYLNFGFFNCQKTVLMYTGVMASKLGRICVALSTVLKINMTQPSVGWFLPFLTTSFWASFLVCLYTSETLALL